MQNYILYIKKIINLFFKKTYYYKYIRYKRNIPFILMLPTIIKRDSDNEYKQNNKNNNN